MRKRPRIVTVVAGFLFAATLIAWTVGVALLHPSPFTDWMFTLNPPARTGFEALGWMAGVLLLALGCGTGAAAVGLRRGRRWAWWFALVLFIINKGGDVVALILLGDWLRSGSGILIGLAFLSALMWPAAKAYCRN